MFTEPEPGGAEPEKKPPRKREKKPPQALDSVYPGQKVRTKTETEELPFEHPEELASRLRREEKREAHELFKEKAVLVMMLVVTLVVLLASSAVLTLSSKTNLQSWAAAALTSTLSGYFGWFTGKQGAK
jgi:hypothetical protein